MMMTFQVWKPNETSGIFKFGGKCKRGTLEFNYIVLTFIYDGLNQFSLCKFVF